MNILLVAAIVGGLGWFLLSGSSIQVYSGPYRLVPWLGADPLTITHTFSDGATTLFITNSPGPWDDKAYTRILSTDGTSCFFVGTPDQFSLSDYKAGAYSTMGNGYYKLV